MEQLLKITNVPIQYELKVNNARLEMKKGTAELELSREKGGLRIKSRPIRVKLDTYEARNSVVPTTKRSIGEFAQKGREAAQESTAEFSREGIIMIKTRNGEGGETLNRIFEMRTQQPDGQFKLGFIPTEGANIKCEGPELSIEYQMDKMNFDWKLSKGNYDFIPGSIEMIINEYPGIEIEYMGEPLYVPPSAAEHFGDGSQIDVKA